MRIRIFTSALTPLTEWDAPSVRGTEGWVRVNLPADLLHSLANGIHFYEIIPARDGEAGERVIGKITLLEQFLPRPGGQASPWPRPSSAHRSRH